MGGGTRYGSAPGRKASKSQIWCKEICPAGWGSGKDSIYWRLLEVRVLEHGKWPLGNGERIKGHRGMQQFTGHTGEHGLPLELVGSKGH